MRILWVIPVMILAAGCINQPGSVTIDKDNGITITNFSADPYEVSYDDLIFITMDIENVGGTKATEVEARLYGVEEIFRHTNGNIIHSVPEKNFGDMNAPNELDNVPGESKTWTYTLLPPQIPEGVTTTFTVTGRTTFKYHTTGTITIPAYSKTLYNAKLKQDEEVETVTNVDNTYAPIQISLKKGTSPVLVDDTKNGTQEAIYIIQFQNVGNGYPVTEDVIGRMYGKITVSGLGVNFADCLGATSGNEVSINETNIDLVKLRSDGNVPVGCSISIDREKWSSTASGSILFNVDMNYKYYVDEDVNIKVHGKPR